MFSWANIGSNEYLPLKNDRKAYLNQWAKRSGLAIAAICILGILILAIVKLFCFKAIIFPIVGGSFNNGTNVFQSTVIVISLDGFRADYLYRGFTPNLLSLAERNVHVPFLIPSFPSITFPNHYTIVTGLYPESHGIVSNNFFDPVTGKQFVNSMPECNKDPTWWDKGEPIWVNAERNNVRSAVHMWPGNEVENHGYRPTYSDGFNFDTTLREKKDRILEWLDLPDKDRPQLLLAYAPHVDMVGHAFGPDSPELNIIIQEVDIVIGELIEGLKKRNIDKHVNIIFLSDHGMAPTSDNRLIWLDNMFNLSAVAHRDAWPLGGFRGESDLDDEYIYESLVNYSRSSLPSAENWNVYSKKDIPSRWHYSNNERIAPVWMIPDVGWSLVSMLDHSPELEYEPLGVHGYDNLSPVMRALFIASGSSFKNFKGKKLAPFQNTEIYGILSHILDLPAQPNNGTYEGALPLRRNRNSTKEWLLKDIEQAYSKLI
ncbi:Nucleotide pyrophosphatase [Schizosaccharomyces pombe]|uniref:Uncharacterized pyrophosphatase/phosphodiesterase C725.05c n=1 Tax=Schizosaccharomyces pombe (strain 972 / ATCC 24843) TaxID=284812 RepID=YGK5_SCHPO|nr:putative nucleotide pyrophosphatase [Schizosaccharomyces pombe]O94323.1 RecName: Full=Uncharacterized pyrophosphatase/phosphodiesterase C725.05c [Schizosaccharomyces pombe 972h-]CAA22177.1 nucleotide pyrophosphatase (predicted) [Schizosaccharomyces pombe]|eukprot:NP_595485.1 putative nucleotide pyrophosphatase [Schizosaccharomyces pombe]